MIGGFHRSHGATQNKPQHKTYKHGEHDFAVVVFGGHSVIKNPSANPIPNAANKPAATAIVAFSSLVAAFIVGPVHLPRAVTVAAQVVVAHFDRRHGAIFVADKPIAGAARAAEAERDKHCDPCKRKNDVGQFHVIEILVFPVP